MDSIEVRPVPAEYERAAALFDGLAALGDDHRIEAEALRWTTPGTDVEPFALRALGVVRDDEQLTREAAARFEALGLHWHSAETQKLLPS